MVMNREVNGLIVECTPDEEAEIRAQWAANAPKPADIIKAQIAAIEAAQPITQRSIRELMLAIGQAFPAAQASVFYQRAAAQDEAVSALRDQL